MNLRRVDAIVGYPTQPANWATHYALIVTAALVLRLAILLVYGIDQTGDTIQYDRIAINLVQGHGYSLSLAEPFVWTTQREPIYPLFLALIYFLFGHSPMAVVLVQCLLGAATCLIIYETALLMFEDRRIALWAGLANALYLPLAIFCARLYSETVALLVMAGVAYLLVRLFARPATTLGAIALGVTMALLALTKLLFVLLPAVLLPLIVLLGHGRRVAWIKSAAIILVAMTVGLLPWIAINYNLHGTFGSGNSVRMAANIYCRVQDRGMKGYDPYAELLELERRGVPTETINRAYEKKVLDIVLDHPIRYAIGFLEGIRDLWRFGFSPNEIGHGGSAPLAGPKEAFFVSVKYFFQAIQVLVLITGLLGFFVARSSRTALVVAIIGYSTLMLSAISCALPRHNVPALQLMLIFSSAWLVRTLFRPRAQIASP